jgi:hypothetical protein
MSSMSVHARSHRALRLGTRVFAAVLGAQSIWLLLSELSRPSVDRVPTTAQAADQAAIERNDGMWAAWIGIIRGDLWADSAFTYADLLWASPDPDGQPNTTLAPARAELDKALGYAPHRADAWLMLAGLEERDSLHVSDPAEALKMSYYTGPSERPLIPLRFRIATRLDALDDVEIQQFIRRDLRFVLGQKQSSVITETYAGASTAGKRLIEQAVGEIDPTYRGLPRTGAQKP